MTTISPNRRRGSSNARLRFIVAGVIFVFIFLILIFWREPVAGVLWRGMGPLSGVRNSLQASAGSFFSGFSSQATLVAQINALRAEVASSSTLVLDRNLLYAENQDLKRRLNRLSGVSSTLASVLARAPGVPYDTLTLDVGSQGGVSVGDLVSAGGSVYIGKITQVYPTASRVLLFSAPGETYDTTLMSATLHTSVPLSVEGQGGGSFTAEVPAGTQVAVGDSVTFPGITPQFIATVTYVESKEQESFKTIFMRLPVNPLMLQYVEVRHPQL